MNQTQESAIRVGRRPSIPYGAIGGKLRKMHPTEPDKCPCCGAALGDDLPKIHLEDNCLLIDGKAIRLQPKHAEIMAILLGNYPRVTTFDALISGLWGQAEPDAAYGCVKNHICRLNKALAPTSASIRGVTSIGYRVVLA